MATPDERCNVAETIWHVYRLSSGTDLLYVGYTRQLKHRLTSHRREKPWWPEVTDILSEEFGSEDDARQRELQVWTDEHPKYNVNCPFRTVEEQERQREWHGGPEKRRQYDRTAKRQDRKKTPEYRAYKSAYNREYRKLGAKRWRQTGPGLF
jgi:predicted GIY-YIG superfamily endonuclease